MPGQDCTASRRESMVWSCLYPTPSICLFSFITHLSPCSFSLMKSHQRQREETHIQPVHLSFYSLFCYDFCLFLLLFDFSSFILLSYICECFCLYICIAAPMCLVPKVREGGIRSPKAIFTESYEAPCRCWELNPGSQQEQQMFLILSQPSRPCVCFEILFLYVT